MGFERSQVLVLPELAAHVGLASPEFVVDRVLRGGMGECIRIFQGEHIYALKIIQTRLIDNSETWNRYLREVKLWMTVSACEGVAEALCAIRVNELPAVCSPWMKGGSLREHLQNRLPQFFYSVMARIVGTLAWVQERYTVVHRDLKPDNILLDGTDLAFVSDWGLARPLSVPDPRPQEHNGRPIRSSGANLTEAGSFIGTILYASPEQLLGSAHVDHRADIYSLGCLMYEWEAGRCPFSGVNAEEIALKHLFEPPRKLGSLLRKTTFGAEEAINACLQKDPVKRLPTYDALNTALSAAAKRRGIPYKRFEPSLRYEMPFVGAGRFCQELQLSGCAVFSEARSNAVVEQTDINKYMHEAEVLMAAGDYGRAQEIYGRVFVPELVTAVPDDPQHQYIAVNYANCLIELGRVGEAVRTLASLSKAHDKPVGYFVNLSLAQIRKAEYVLAAGTATEGLVLNGNDPDLMGNLLTAQTAAGIYAQAADTAKTRLAQSRDIHSLHEVSLLHSTYADSIRDLDWPLAFKNYKHAVELLREAKTLNPRYLRVRLQLPTVLQEMAAYDQCSDEIKSMQGLELHTTDWIYLTYLQARCMDRVGAYGECLEFCNRSLKSIDELQAKSSLLRMHALRLERVRASTVADGFCIGMMDGDQRVFVPSILTFFTDVVEDAELRQREDFCYLARLHEWLENYETAADVLRRAETLYPDYWEIPFRQAEFRVRAGDHHGAVEPASRASALAPWQARTWELLADVLVRTGRLGESEAAKEHAEEIGRTRRRLEQEMDLV